MACTGALCQWAAAPTGFSSRHPAIGTTARSSAAVRSAPESFPKVAPHRRRERVRRHSASPASPFADGDGSLSLDSDRQRVTSQPLNAGGDDPPSTSLPSPELARAQRALLWRHHAHASAINADGGDRKAGVVLSQPLDVYTEVLLMACSNEARAEAEEEKMGVGRGHAEDGDRVEAAAAAGAAGDTAGASAGAGAGRYTEGFTKRRQAAEAAAAAGWSSAGIASVLDHLAFDRLQVIMAESRLTWFRV